MYMQEQEARLMKLVKENSSLLAQVQRWRERARRCEEDAVKLRQKVRELQYHLETCEN